MAGVTREMSGVQRREQEAEREEGLVYIFYKQQLCINCDKYFAFKFNRLS